ncbi:hypothetical protein CVT26_001500 [Gymnopilus dilepis]|uniref:Uncharacterized protein n=1 Tax=Gymnopilus dilepis TaxID=231916 RepID=A0A409WEC8_9AGAR|nr:hypothetical protein CVT26_001500 [Gymnopilus dilepis]
MEGLEEADDVLVHKWADDGPPVVAVDPLFDFADLLSCLPTSTDLPSSPLNSGPNISAASVELNSDLFSLSPLSSAEWSDDGLDEDSLLLSPPDSNNSDISFPSLTPSDDALCPGKIKSHIQTPVVADISHEADAPAPFDLTLQCPSTVRLSDTEHTLDPKIAFSSHQTASVGQCSAHASDPVPQKLDHKARGRGRNHEGRRKKRQQERRQESSSSSHQTASIGQCSTHASDPVPQKLNHTARGRGRNHEGRRKKRQQERRQEFSNYEPRSSKDKDSAPPIHIDLATEKCATTSAAFVGLNDSSGARRVFSVDELVGEKAKRKFGYVSWDGRVRRTVTDAKGRNVAFLAGQPNAKDWPQLMQAAGQALETLRPHLSIPKQERVHRRGAFPAVRCGVSHGGGTTHPGNLTNNKENTAVVEELCGMECFKRLAGFATSVMASKAPKLYHYYVEHLAELHANHPNIKRLFPSSVFAAASFNFGPRTVCRKHKDFANLPFGLCAVTALGNFDPRKGGHLVLWECGLVIEFPPGATILLPSAIVAHSNTPVQSHETRYSFAQYTAGGLFRWIEHGCMLAADFYASLSTEELEAVHQKDAERWQYGLSLFEQAAQVERGT